MPERLPIAKAYTARVVKKMQGAVRLTGLSFPLMSSDLRGAVRISVILRTSCTTAEQDRS